MWRVVDLLRRLNGGVAVPAREGRLHAVAVEAVLEAHGQAGDFIHAEIVGISDSPPAAGAVAAGFKILFGKAGAAADFAIEPSPRCRN